MSYTKGTTAGGWIYAMDNKGMPVALVHPKHIDEFLATPDLREALKGLRTKTQSLTHRKHHSLCYGLDIEAHPDCELCKIIRAEKVADEVLAKAESK